MERHEQVGRTAATGRRCRRVAVMVAVSLIGALLALPVVAASTAPSAAAASEVPPCPPGTNPNNANCIPADAVPAGGSRPADPSPGAARPWDANRVALPITVTGPSLGGLCPDGGVPYSAMPCTHRGVSAGARAYVPGSDQAGALSSFGIGQSQEAVPGAPDGTCRTTADWSCTLLIIYNPALVQGTVHLIVSVSTMVVGDTNGDGNFLEGLGYSFAISISGTASATPTASFDVGGGVGTAADPKTFLATSKDPSGSPLLHRWDFGDGQRAEGGFVTHAYAKPGEYSASLTSTNLAGRVATATKKVTIAAPKLGVSVDLLNGVLPPLDPEVPVKAKVTVAASSDGVGALTGIRFADGSLLKVAPAGAFAVTDGPNPALPTIGFDLQPGDKKTFEVTLTPKVLGRYTLSSQVTGTDASGATQSATGSSPGEIGQPFPVTVTFLRDGNPIDGNEIHLPDDPITKQPQPVTVTAVTKITNDRVATLRGVELQPMDLAAADPTHPFTNFPVAVGGKNDPVKVADLAPGQSVEVRRQLVVSGDGNVVAKSLVASDAGVSVGRGNLRIGLTTMLEVSLGDTTSINVTAGSPVIVHGRFKNRTNDRTIALTDPIRVTYRGNLLGGGYIQEAEGAALFSDFPKPLTGEIAPGQSVAFQVRLNTVRPTVGDYVQNVAGMADFTEGTVSFNLLSARAAVKEEDGTWSALASEPVTVVSKYPGSVRVTGGDGGVIHVGIDTTQLAQGTVMTRAVPAAFGLSVGALEGARDRAVGVFNFAYHFTLDPEFRDKTFAEAFADSESQATLRMLANLAVYVPQADQQEMLNGLSQEIVSSLTAFNATLADGRWRQPTPTQAEVKARLTAYLEKLQGAWASDDPMEIADAVRPIGNVVGATTSDVLMTELAFQGLVRLMLADRYFNAAVAAWKDQSTVAKMKANFPSAAQVALDEKAFELSKSKYPLLEEAFIARRPLTNVDLGVGLNKDGAGLAKETIAKAREWTAANPNRTMVLIPNEANVAAVRDAQAAVGKIENIKPKSMADLEYKLFGGRAEDQNFVLLRKIDKSKAEVDKIVDEAIAAGTAAEDDRAVAQQIVEKRKKEWALFNARGNVKKVDGVYVPDVDPATNVVKPDGLGIGNLKGYDEAGFIPNQFRGIDNGLAVKGPEQTPKFTLDYLDDAYKPTTPDKASYVVPRQESPVTGRLVKITGDDDGIFIGQLNGLGLAKSEIEGAYTSLMDVFNHPFSDTWLAAVNKKIEIFSRYFETIPGTQTKGAPLVMFSNGEAYAVKINPWATRFDTAANRAFLDFVGAPSAVDVLGAEAAYRSIALDPVRQLLLPINFIRMLLQKPGAAFNGAKIAMTAKGSVVRLNAAGGLDTWTSEGGWIPNSAAAARFRGGQLTLAPQSFLTTSTQPGATAIDMADAGELAATGDWFRPGDQVVIDPGGPNQEVATVERVASLHFAVGLTKPHSPGEIVASLGPAPQAPGTPNSTPNPTHAPVAHAPVDQVAVASAGQSASVGNTNVASATVSGRASTSGHVSHASGAAGGGTALAVTGGDADAPVRVGVALLCLGLLFVAFSRRRRRFGPTS